MAAYQNITYYYASSNLTTQPECSAVCASFQPAAATSEEPQPVSSAQIYGQSWTNKQVRGGTEHDHERERGIRIGLRILCMKPFLSKATENEAKKLVRVELKVAGLPLERIFRR